MFKSSIAAAALAALIAVMSAKPAQAVIRLEGEFAPTTSANLVLSMWWYEYGIGDITFTGADLVSVKMVTESAIRVQQRPYGLPIAVIPLRGECEAAVGETCLTNPGNIFGGRLYDVTESSFEFVNPSRLGLQPQEPIPPGRRKIVGPLMVTTFTFEFAPHEGVDAIGYKGSYITGSIPEPSTWAMMILGFAAAGSILRRRNAALGLAAGIPARPVAG